MTTYWRIYAYILIALSLFGCNDSRKANFDNKPADTDGLKITDIASTQTKITDSLMIKNICIECIEYEMPIENFALLSEIWPLLSENSLSFNSQKAFWANSFVLGYGKAEIWNEVAQKLKQNGAKKIITTTLLFSSEQEFDIQSAYIPRAASISYIDANLQVKKNNLSEGELCLRLKAKKPSYIKGVCNLYGRIFHIQKNIRRIESSSESEFKEIGFAAQMNQGDFLILAPGPYLGDDTSLTKIFFYKNKKRPCIKFYVLFCTGIID